MKWVCTLITIEKVYNVPFFITHTCVCVSIRPRGLLTGNLQMKALSSKEQACCQCCPQTSESSFMGRLHLSAAVGKAKGADVSVSSVDDPFSFLIHWVAIIFFNNETFVNSEM